MPKENTKVFLSYARQDLEIAKRVEQALREKECLVWRDQENVYGGQNWPKALGESIADHEVVLLLWSENARQAHFVEFEWSTAVALKKPVIPCLLDETPLPSTLATFKWHSFDR
jgi:hypothetical protein